MKKRPLTKREKVLLVILALIVVGFGYFKLVHEPVQRDMQDAADRIATADTDLVVETARYLKMRDMEKELEELTAAGQMDKYDLPDYDNLRDVMFRLNALLLPADKYTLTFGELDCNEDGLVSRPIHMTLTARNYATARSIINSIHQCRFPCRIDSISISAGKRDISDNPVEVSLTVTFYERVQP